ncbi:MAG: hypothetical protein ACO24W_03040 [Candidatus Nanopelagicales bacterium]
MLDWIVDWWNTVFYSLMGGNWFLMFFFGWEIFLIPIGFIAMIFFVVINFIFTVLGSLFKR